MDVRLARPTDAALILELALDDGAHIVRGTDTLALGSAGGTLVRTVLPVAGMGRMWIAADGADAALLEAQPRQYVIGWDVTRLAARGNAESMLQAVVGAATAHLQCHGVPRLFARCREQHESLMQALDFHPLAREYILLGPETRPAGGNDLPEGARYRRPEDAWPLHQLQSEVTPALIRHMEGLTSLDWSQRSKALTEIVVERDGKLVAWTGWGTKPRRGHVQLGLLLHPEHEDAGADLIYHVLQLTAPATRLVTRVREYQDAALRTLIDAGFTVGTEELLVLKHARAEPARARSRLQIAAVPGMPMAPLAWKAPRRHFTLEAEDSTS